MDTSHQDKADISELVDYTRSDIEFRERGVDDYLHRHQLTRLDFGLFVDPVHGTSRNLETFTYTSFRKIVPPGVFCSGLAPPVGNPSPDEVKDAISGLLRRRLLQIAKPEDIAKVEWRVQSGVFVFPNVWLPRVCDVIVTEEAQGIWLDVVHGLIGANSDPEPDYESDTSQIVHWSVTPFVQENCLMWASDDGSVCLKCDNRTTIESIGPVMDYWWRIVPQGYRMTCRLTKRE